ncbi:SusC/RagA family TonB-linked outer membrane protein [Paraflavitalea pollutisoli]|uniref:SusC/RagA family TonB-linked outer membrane protein n=1 Tax=Paraflavitalea pollutisoli TaxID=3034143 RepID=UPI0023EBE8F6|nr:SusC/RagA family TonB-linked outer membrane protein [Paraflavitalea sp. H1-2-19X]
MRKILCSLLAVLLLLIQLGVQAQERTISGKVSDATGMPLPGASVTVKGSTLGTSTGSDGSFSLRVPANAKTLTISAVGFTSQDLTIGSRSVFDIALAVEGKGLDEVIITGYGQQKRSQYAGAASKVEAKAINQVPNGSIDQILQGRAAGMYVTAGSGQPGASANVVIRGVGTIGGSSTPLYIMDGIPVQAATFSALTPSDIASVDVLKDAVATALYGSRGSNGVIVITTKRGKIGNKITYGAKAQVGFSDRTRPKFEMMNSKQRLQYEAEVGAENDITIGPGWYLNRNNPANAGLPPSTLQRYDQILDSLGNTNADWEDIFFRRGRTQEYEVNASGGSDKVAFYSSLNYFKQDGISIRSSLERFSLRNNVDIKGDRLTIGINSTLNYATSSGIESENTTAVSNPFASVYYALPYELPYKDGVLMHPGNASGPDGGNPLVAADPDKPYLVYDQREGSTALERMLATTRRTNEIKAVLGANIRYRITDELALVSTLGLDFRETLTQRFIDPSSYTGTLVPGAQGSMSEGTGRFMRLFGNAGFNFNKTIAGLHAVDASVLVENTKATARSFNYVGYGINPLLPNTPAGVTPGSADGFIPTVGGGRDANVLQSLIAIARYTYDGKYTFNGSFRVDRSSMVPKDNRSISYFAVGATWNMLKESFLQNADFLSELQLRASYGTSASPFNSSFGYLSLYGATVYNGVPGNGLAQLGNPNYDWEYANTTNIGIDFGFLNSRIRGTIELYNKATKNLFVSQKLSAWSGDASLDINAGKMRNRGVELTITGDVVANNFIRWSVGGNIGINQNRITSLGQVNEFELGTSIIRVGLPFGAHYIPKWAGVDAATGNPLYYNKDGSITSSYNSTTQSVAEFGSWLPKYNGGFNTRVDYKNFYVEAFFSFVGGNKRFNNEDFFNETSSFATSNQSTRLLERWRKPGDVTNIQKFGTSRSFSSKDIQDASFVRFRNLNAGYTIPKKWLQEMRIFSAATIYVMGQNLYTFTNWRGFDPEDNNNISTFEYPAQRSFVAGLNLTF